MQTILAILVFIVVLMIIIVIHELGHFVMARKANILCHEFSLGMGPLIWKKKKGETVYSIRAIPIGGYVSMAGEDADQDMLQGVENVRLIINSNKKVTKIICDVNEPKFQDAPKYKIVSYDLFGTKKADPNELFIEVQEEGQEDIRKFVVKRDCLIYFNKKQEFQIAPKDRSMNSKTVKQRILTIFGGPFMNFVLALVIYFIIGLIQGYPMVKDTVIDEVTKDAPVYDVLSKGDRIERVEEVELDKWDDLSKVMNSLATGEKEFNGKIKVDYYTTDKVLKVAYITPAVAINALELTLERGALEENKVVVGEYLASNTKTKSYKAGLRKGDVIKSINVKDGDVVLINDVSDLLVFINTLDDAVDVEIKYERTNEEGIKEEKQATIESYSKSLLDSQGVQAVKVQLGVSPTYKFDLLKTLYMPFVNTAESSVSIFKTLGLLFTDSSVQLDDFSGPVGIFQLVNSTLAGGVVAVLSLMAFLSVNIGFVNLLPIPALDGCRLVFVIYEGITKKKPSPKVENIVHSIGFILLMALFVFISFNDILRLFGCK